MCNVHDCLHVHRWGVSSTVRCAEKRKPGRIRPNNVQTPCSPAASLLDASSGHVPWRVTFTFTRVLFPPSPTHSNASVQPAAASATRTEPQVSSVSVLLLEESFCVRWAVSHVSPLQGACYRVNGAKRAFTAGRRVNEMFQINLIIAEKHN